jgi:hypothetical protein
LTICLARDPSQHFGQEKGLDSHEMGPSEKRRQGMGATETGWTADDQVQDSPKLECLSCCCLGVDVFGLFLDEHSLKLEKRSGRKIRIRIDGENWIVAG